MSEKTRKELTERAFQKMISGEDDQISLGIIDLKKAREFYAFQGDFEDKVLDIIICMAEISSGINRSKQVLLKLIVEDLQIGGSKKIDHLTPHESVYINAGARKFMEEQISEFWLKSIKYDAIVKALESSESDEPKCKDTLAKVLAIIGKSQN